jgi:toxin ParE1/3/4
MRRRHTRPQGRVDLLEIWHHIAEDSIDNAHQMAAELEEATQLLARFPGMGHHRSDVPEKYLCWAVDPYVIVYHYDGKRLIVERVLHGARDFKRIFKGK